MNAPELRVHLYLLILHSHYGRLETAVSRMPIDSSQRDIKPNVTFQFPIVLEYRFEQLQLLYILSRDVDVNVATTNQTFLSRLKRLTAVQTKIVKEKNSFVSLNKE